MYEGLLLLKESYLVATLILALDSPLSTAPSIPASVPAPTLPAAWAPSSSVKLIPENNADINELPSKLATKLTTATFNFSIAALNFC